MRKLLTHLLILLTAFHGMVGNVMAYGMMQEATELIAIHVDSTPAIGQVDHKKSSVMPCHSAGDEDIATHAAEQCKTCQICHLSAYLVQPVLAASPMLASEPLATFAENFTSADPLRAAEPPIL